MTAFHGTRPVILLLLFLCWIWTSQPHPPTLEAAEQFTGRDKRVFARCTCKTTFTMSAVLQTMRSMTQLLGTQQLGRKSKQYAGCWINSPATFWSWRLSFFFFLQSKKWTISVLLIYVGWTTVGGFTAVQHYKPHTPRSSDWRWPLLMPRWKKFAIVLLRSTIPQPLYASQKLEFIPS